MDHITTIDVEGMTCTNCVAHVSEELEQVAGIQDVSVDLRTGEASPVRVVSDHELDDRTLREAIDEAGYAVAAIAR